jgi:hypothetical protein
MSLVRHDEKRLATRPALPLLLSVFFLIFCSAIVPAMAQNADCERVRAQIASLDQGGGGGRAGSYGAAAQRQQAELARTAAYAQSLGCNGNQYFFGRPPPQCGELNARIRAMQDNIAQLQGMSARGGGGNSAQRQNLAAWYESYCKTRPRGFFEQLFGGSSSQPAPIEAPPEELPPEEDQQARGGSQAICVRTCDGGFFPLNYSARRSNLDSLEDLCKALCPNAEVALYTRNPSNEVSTAVSADGTPYRDLPNAFKFQKNFDQSCTCKPPGVSWEQALTQSDAQRRYHRDARKIPRTLAPESSIGGSAHSRR